MANYVDNFEIDNSEILIRDHDVYENMRFKGGTILLVGDSGFTRMPEDVETLIKNITKAENVINLSVGGANWSGVYTQLSTYTGARPDLILMINVSSSVTSSSNIGDRLGTPDVFNMNVNDLDTTQFMLMKKCLKFIRENFAETHTCTLFRFTPPEKQKALWHYYKFYCSQILMQWGFPYIDMDAVYDFTYGIETDYLDEDGLHLSAEGYERVYKTISHMLNSGSVNQYLEPPTTFYVPSSVTQQLETDGISTQATLYAYEVLKWVADNCYYRSFGYNETYNAIELSGEAYVTRYNTSTVINYAFKLQRHYSVSSQLNRYDIIWVFRGRNIKIVKRDNNDLKIYNDIQSGFYYGENGGVDIATLPDGDYMFNGVATRTTGAANFPVELGGLLIVRTMKTSYFQEQKNLITEGFRSYLYIVNNNNNVYVGHSTGTGTITWNQLALVQ